MPFVNTFKIQNIFFKRLAAKTTLMAYPDFSKAFILHTDASREGLGVVLYQKREGVMRVVAYAS